MSAKDKRETTAAYHAAEAKRTAASTPLFSPGRKRTHNNTTLADHLHHNTSQMVLMMSCISACTAASHDQRRFMEGWVESQVVDFIHHNSALVDRDDVDKPIGENGGHKHGCWSRGVYEKDENIHTGAPASQKRSGSSGNETSTGVSLGPSVPGGTSTGVYPGHAVPGGGIDEYAHVPAMPVLCTKELE